MIIKIYKKCLLTVLVIGCISSLLAEDESTFALLQEDPFAPTEAELEYVKWAIENGPKIDCGQYETFESSCEAQSKEREKKLILKKKEFEQSFAEKWNTLTERMGNWGIEVQYFYQDWYEGKEYLLCPYVHRDSGKTRLVLVTNRFTYELDDMPFAIKKFLYEKWDNVVSAAEERWLLTP